MAKLTPLQKSFGEKLQEMEGIRDRAGQVYEDLQAADGRHERLDDVMFHLLVVARDANQLALGIRLLRDICRDQQEIERLRVKENSDSSS